MPDDKKQERDDEEQQQPQHSPASSPPGTLQNFPSGSSVNPVGGQAQFVNFLQNIQSMSYQKEPDSDVVKAQTGAVISISNNLKEENLRQIDYQESRDVKDHDIITKREGRQFLVTAAVLGTVIAIVGIGVYLLVLGQTAIGASLLAGGLGTILGFLGGMGVSKKL